MSARHTVANDALNALYLRIDDNVCLGLKFDELIVQQMPPLNADRYWPCMLGRPATGKLTPHTDRVIV